MGALHPIEAETVRLAVASSARREEYLRELARENLATVDRMIAELAFWKPVVLAEDRARVDAELEDLHARRARLVAEVARGL
jgi:hypothetical protein